MVLTNETKLDSFLEIFKEQKNLLEMVLDNMEEKETLNELFVKTMFASYDELVEIIHEVKTVLSTERNFQKLEEEIIDLLHFVVQGMILAELIRKYSEDTIAETPIDDSVVVNSFSRFKNLWYEICTLTSSIKSPTLKTYFNDYVRIFTEDKPKLMILSTTDYVKLEINGFDMSFYETILELFDLCHSVLKMTNWKFWKRTKVDFNPVDISKLLTEIVMIIVLIMGKIQTIKFDYKGDLIEYILTKYREKCQVNVERQNTGY